MTPEDPVERSGKSASGSARLNEVVRRFLDEWVGSDDLNRGFVEAVVLHLGAGATAAMSQMQAAEQVVRIVRPAYNTDPDPSRVLLRHPELMASLFQNADLLDPADPASAELSKTVMKAMASIQS